MAGSLGELSVYKIYIYNLLCSFCMICIFASSHFTFHLLLLCFSGTVMSYNRHLIKAGAGLSFFILKDWVSMRTFALSYT